MIACPHDVIGYEHEEGKYKPFHLEEELGLDNCIHGEKGCTSCTRACPRFRAWEPEADEHLFGRDPRARRDVRHLPGHLLLTRASDDMVARDRPGRRPRLGDAHLGCSSTTTSTPRSSSYLEGDGTTWKAMPGVAAQPRTRSSPSAGSRYTYSANTLAVREALERGLLERSRSSA